MNITLKNECYNHAKWQQAEPTSRRLPDNDPRQEWSAYGDLDGIPVVAYWLFTPEQVTAAGDDDGQLPWHHIDRVEVDIYGCDRDSVSVGAVETLMGKWGLTPAAAMGRRGGLAGGAAKTKKKAEASRANGAKGGRPKKAKDTGVNGQDRESYTDDQERENYTAK